jgi:hypothetical protein
MEKVEKLENNITDKGHLVAGIEPATREQMHEKINEIIDRLNEQEEEKREVVFTKPTRGVFQETILNGGEIVSQRTYEDDLPEERVCMKCKKVIPTGEANSSIDGSFICCDECLWKDTTGEIQSHTVNEIGYDIPVTRKQLEKELDQAREMEDLEIQGILLLIAALLVSFLGVGLIIGAMLWFFSTL